MEIIEQVIFFARYLKKACLPTGRESQRITNVVFMGMGEPFLNYENVFKAVRILNDKDGANIEPGIFLFPPSASRKASKNYPRKNSN